jgi:hypothetical protein
MEPMEGTSTGPRHVFTVMIHATGVWGKLCLNSLLALSHVAACENSCPI